MRLLGYRNDRSQRRDAHRAANGYERDRDLVGRRVSVRRGVERRDGLAFKAGTQFWVAATWRGLFHLDAVGDAKGYVRMVSRFDFDILPRRGPHDRPDCPCGHAPRTKGECAGCNCADGPP